MKSFMLAVLAFLGGVYSMPSSSQPIYMLQCDGCSMQQMGQLVSDTIQYDGVPFDYDFYVYSLSPFVAQRFGVERELGFNLTYPLATDSQFSVFLDALQGLAESNGNSLEFYLDMRTDAGSASGFRIFSDSKVGVYDYLRSPAIQSQVSDRVNQGFAGAQAAWLAILSSFTSPVLNFERSVTARIVFKDGVAYVKYNFDTRQFEFIPNSARDSNGNTIPMTAADFADGGYKQYYFEGPGGAQDLANFLYQAQLLGIPVVGGGGWIVGCSKIGETIRCTTIQR